jgi:hypothetical protein
MSATSAGNSSSGPRIRGQADRRGRAAGDLCQAGDGLTGIDKGMGAFCGPAARSSARPCRFNTALASAIAAPCVRWASTSPDGPVLRQARGRRDIFPSPRSINARPRLRPSWAVGNLSQPLNTDARFWRLQRSPGGRDQGRCRARVR